jgi:hypothetical protein
MKRRSAFPVSGLLPFTRGIGSALRCKAKCRRRMPRPWSFNDDALARFLIRRKIMLQFSKGLNRSNHTKESEAMISQKSGPRSASREAPDLIEIVWPVVVVTYLGALITGVVKSFTTGRQPNRRNIRIVTAVLAIPIPQIRQPIGIASIPTCCTRIAATGDTTPRRRSRHIHFRNLTMGGMPATKVRDTFSAVVVSQGAETDWLTPVTKIAGSNQLNNRRRRRCRADRRRPDARQISDQCR